MSSGNQQQRVDPYPPANFIPAHIHTAITHDHSNSVTQWLTSFRTMSERRLDSDIDVIGLDEGQGLSWLDALKQSQEKFEGNCEMSDFEECDADSARTQMKMRLHKSMAYSVVFMEEDAADAWARSFVDSFSSPDTLWYSNWEVGTGNSSSWNPVTSATFDLCIVAVDTASSTIGYLLVTDED